MRRNQNLLPHVFGVGRLAASAVVIETMVNPQTHLPERQAMKIRLFDSYGMPWTSHLSLGWLAVLTLATGGLADIFIALFIGVWLRARTGSVIVLATYILCTASCAILCLPIPTSDAEFSNAAGLVCIASWFAGALIARYQIGKHYARREGADFPLSLPLTLLFGPLYLNYQLRPEFPDKMSAVG